ncbi:MAG: hypothetical protein WKI04_17815 [Ferruginibacter sp.]
MKIIAKQLVVLFSTALLIILFLGACNKMNPSPGSNTSHTQLQVKQRAFSPAEATKFQQWKIGIGYNWPETGCIQTGGTGPYDPTDCLRKQLEELSVLRTKAKGNLEILDIITTGSAEIIRILKTWQSLTLKQKQKRQAIFSAIRKSINDNGNNVKKGAEIFSCQTQDQEAIAMARSIQDGKGNWCIVGCICVTAEGCPCCAWDDLIKIIFGSDLPN